MTEALSNAVPWTSRNASSPGQTSAKTTIQEGWRTAVDVPRYFTVLADVTVYLGA